MHEADAIAKKLSAEQAAHIRANASAARLSKSPAPAAPPVEPEDSTAIAAKAMQVLGDAMASARAASAAAGLAFAIPSGPSASPPAPPSSGTGDAHVDDLLTRISESIAKARDLMGQVPDDTPPARVRGIEAGIRKLARANQRAREQLERAAAQRNAELAFALRGTEAGKAENVEALVKRIEAMQRDDDLTTIRAEIAKADRPADPVNRITRSNNDRLDQTVRDRMLADNIDYPTALDRTLSDRRP